MADLIIRGMEMPGNCLYCHFISYDNDHCVVMDKDIPIYGTKPSWCPLVPLPAGHGRLGDLDELYEAAKTRSMGLYGPCNYQCVITGNDILKAHTIIPAEEGGKDG